MSEVSENTVGFWKHGNRLVSNWLRKGRIPKSCRLVLVKNKYKENGDKKPDFIGYFVETKDNAAFDIKQPYAVLRSQIKEDNQLEEENNIEQQSQASTRYGTIDHIAENLSYYL